MFPIFFKKQLFTRILYLYSKKIVFASQRVLYQYFNACKYVVKNIKSKWTKSKKTRWYLLKCIQSFNVLKCNLFKVYHMVILYFYNKKVLMMAL